MIARLANYPLMHYIFSMLPECVEPILLKEMWMCFNEVALDCNMDISFDFDRTEQGHSGYTDIMRVPAHVIGDKSRPEADFAQIDMLPDIEKVLIRRLYLISGMLSKCM